MQNTEDLKKSLEKEQAQMREKSKRSKRLAIWLRYNLFSNFTEKHPDKIQLHSIRDDQ